MIFTIITLYPSNHPHHLTILTTLPSSPPYHPHHLTILTTLPSSPPYHPHHLTILTTLPSSPPYHPHHLTILKEMDCVRDSTRWLKRMLHKMAVEEGKDWDKLLHKLLLLTEKFHRLQLGSLPIRTPLWKVCTWRTSDPLEEVTGR